MLHCKAKSVNEEYKEGVHGNRIAGSTYLSAIQSKFEN
jgi:hypothetical protein